MLTLSSSTVRSFYSIWLICCSSSSWSLIHWASSLCLTSCSNMFCQNSLPLLCLVVSQSGWSSFLVPCRIFPEHLNLFVLLTFFGISCYSLCFGFRSSLQAMSCSSAVILCFLRMILSFLFIMLVVFPLLYSVMMDMSPLSLSICFWSLCYKAGGQPLGFLLVAGFGGVILLFIRKTTVYCIWLMVVRSMLSVDVSSIILSKVLTNLFQFLVIFQLR